MSTSGFGLWHTLVEEKFAPVPLTAVSVKVAIINLVAEVEIVQNYVNERNHSIEAVYKFPLTEGAGICKFSAEVDGREIKSVVKEKVDEETDYDEATRRDPTAFMIKEKRPDIFMVEVGGVAAKSKVIIRMKYITDLKMEGDEIRFTLPWTIAPCYVPAKDESAAPSFWSKLFPTTHHIQQVPYQLKFEAAVSMTSGIKSIRSPTHQIFISNVFETKRTVTLSEATASMDQDLLLYVKVVNPYEGCLVLEKSAKGSSAMMLSILPKFKHEAEHKAELIFVIDRSSSMNGAGIQQARRALLLFLHSVRADCYVNFVGFGSTSHLLFPVGSRKYDDAVLKLVQEYAAAMEADLGGSEILEPLQAVFELPTIEGYVRQVFVITDGLDSDKDDVISLVKQFSGTARVFTLGLGRHVPRDFLEDIARVGNGTAVFAPSLEEGLGDKLIQQLRDALRPSWSNIKLKWEGFGKEELKVTRPLLRQAPVTGKIPPVFSGKHLVVYALFREGAHIPQKATLTVHTPEKTVLSIKILLDPMTTDGFLIHRMAAKKLIHGLQDRSDETAKKETIKLARTYGLASSFTSFVAVDPMKPDTTLKGSPMMMKSSDVPVQPSNMVKSSSAVSDGVSSAMSAMSLDGSSLRIKQKLHEPVSTHKKEKVKGPIGEGKMMKVIGLQHANGSFKLGGAVLPKILDSSLDEIIEAGQKAKCPDELWPTLIAVSYLTLGLPQFRDSWALVVEKANDWLSTLEFEDKLKQKAAKFIYAKLKL